MRILFLTHYYAPDVMANAIIVTQLAQELVKLGNQVTVITSVPHYDSQAISPAYKRVLAKRSTEMDGNLVIWHTWLFLPRNKGSAIQRFISYFSYNMMSAVLAPFLGQHDIILTVSPPLTNGIVAHLGSLVMRAPFIYGIFDLFPDLPIELGLIKNQSLISFLYKLEKFIYARAAAITTLTDKMCETVKGKGISANKIHVIPNFVDADFVTPRNKDNNWSRAHGLHDKFVVMYTGNIGTAQNVEILIDAAQILEDDNRIHIAIVGGGAAKAALVEKAELLGLTNITLLPAQPHENIPDLFASTDVLLVSLKEGVAEHSVPSKTYTIMASGRPILASLSKSNAVYTIINVADCGYYVPPDNPQALADMIQNIFSNPDLAQEKGLNGRKYVEQHYTVRRIAEQYHHLMLELTNRS